jgi:hypothetical protein
VKPQCGSGGCKRLGVVGSGLAELPTSFMHLYDDTESIDAKLGETRTVAGRECVTVNMSFPGESIGEETRMYELSRADNRSTESGPIELEGCVDTEKGFFASANVTGEAGIDGTVSLELQSYSDGPQNPPEPPTPGIVSANCEYVEGELELKSATLVSMTDLSTAPVRSGDLTRIARFTTGYEPVTVDFEESGNRTAVATFGEEKVADSCQALDTG